jgi:threonine/homoserine/homoserine lactone efflux protein
LSSSSSLTFKSWILSIYNPALFVAHAAIFSKFSAVRTAPPAIFIACVVLLALISEHGIKG